jgi:hypothetical protein
LVITLLMLSAITFLAVAFLAMSRRDRAQVTATMDVDSARNMSDAALNRAQAEIVAQMEARGDALSYDYMVSQNYISPFGFNKNSKDTTNVNYDIYTSSGAINPLFNMSLNQAAWAQNIANLYYDPRPPVFVVTNSAFPNKSDFRFWVDINRNGKFETNGYQPVIMENGFTNGNWQYFNGEPEWIGVLRDPLNRHSATNIFIGRYAYMVLPIGKTLDFNYIHNFAKGNYVNSLINRLTNDSVPGFIETDGYARDQGIASYELNLAALLDIVCPDAYQYGFPNDPYYVMKKPYLYQYNAPYLAIALPNKGFAFDDAEAIFHYRYWNWPVIGGSQYLGFGPMKTIFRSLYTGNTNFDHAGIDAYCLTAQTVPPFDPTNTIQQLVLTQKVPYPGSYSSNMFYDPQDLFDPTKTSVGFTNRMLRAGYHTNSEDRYTFERLLANIGTGSQPEYGVWVNDDFGQPTLRTKVNLNFDNTFQIQRGPYSPMPTNLVNWTPLGFFTNAAELLLRSQTFTFTNYVLGPGGTYQLGNPPTLPSSFGVTNIPVFRFNYPGVQYNEAVHRMLQMAANIYSATIASNYAPYKTSLPSPGGPQPPVRHPFVFRPLFQRVHVGSLNDGIDIVGFTNDVSDASTALLQMSQVYYPLSSNNVINGYINDFAKRGSTGFNVEGIPWVVSAEKGTPQFYQYSYDNRILFTRKVLFSRYNNGGQPDTNRPPQFTNQFYVMTISNSFGIGAWNPYTTPYGGSGSQAGTAYYLSNYVTIELTNNQAIRPYGYTNWFSYVWDPRLHVNGKILWKAWNGVPTASSTAGFVTLFSNNVVGIPPCYFSESQQRLVFFTNGIISSNSFLPQDTSQTGWPVHNWTLNVTNHVVYALFDGQPQGNGSSALLDYVNLGPFGSSISFTNTILQQGGGGLPGSGSPFANNPWAIGLATTQPNSPMSAGLLYQIGYDEPTDAAYYNSLLGNGSQQHLGGFVFGPDYNPSNVLVQTETWVANDPLVHYMASDLKYPSSGPDTVQNVSGSGVGLLLLSPMTNEVGRISKRYDPWGMAGGKDTDMLLKDPAITSASAWAFPSNKLASVGLLGRVHRGTPWQTVYFKSDNPANDNAASSWLQWTSSPWNGVTQPDNYPTNDWVLPDLFTTALNDNSARGLLSVNQTNYGAWAAAFGGVIALTNVEGGIPIDPTSVYQFLDGTTDSKGNPLTNGINNIRSANVNGLFHKTGEILAAPALTVQSPFLTNSTLATVSDEVVERIPQQIMGLLKVGEPQFVVYAWGESLRPKNLYLSSPNNNLCTNYEITGEFLSRTVCHVVHTNGPPKMVIDSYNIEPAN